MDRVQLSLNTVQRLALLTTGTNLRVLLRRECLATVYFKGNSIWLADIISALLSPTSTYMMGNSDIISHLKLLLSETVGAKMYFGIRSVRIRVWKPDFMSVINRSTILKSWLRLTSYKTNITGNLILPRIGK